MDKRAAKRKAGKSKKLADLPAKRAQDVVGGDSKTKTATQPSESLSLNFTKIEYKYIPQSGD